MSTTTWALLWAMIFFKLGLMLGEYRSPKLTMTCGKVQVKPSYARSNSEGTFLVVDGKAQEMPVRACEWIKYSAED